MPFPDWMTQKLLTQMLGDGEDADEIELEEDELEEDEIVSEGCTSSSDEMATSASWPKKGTKEKT